MFVDGFSTLKARVHEKHAALVKAGKFPDISARTSQQLERINWASPFETHLARFKKSIMFVVPWLYVGGADVGMFSFSIAVPLFCVLTLLAFTRCSSHDPTFR